MKEYLGRLVDNKVEEYLEIFGAVCIEGAKWCGKTWTSKHHSKSNIFLGDPSGGFQNKKLAELNPTLILNGDTPRLIDEWQEVPAMWDAVRYEVDKRGEKGQFILTGSSTPVLKGVIHSGAGRIATIKMRPMSLFESKESCGLVSLEGIFNGNFSEGLVEEPSLEELIHLVVRGGWPAALSFSERQSEELTKSYMEAIIHHDVFRLEGINRDTDKMIRLLKSLARNESTTVSISALKKDILDYEQETIDEDTIASYLSVFERLFLIENQSAFSTNIRSSVRVKKSDKRHFVDPSLAAAMLGVTHKTLWKDLKTLGFLFEALCERDLRIYAESFGGKLSHYQDYANKEIDAVIELPDGRWGAFEIKLGANQIDEAAANLIKIKEKMEKTGGTVPSVMAVICGKCAAAYQRKDGIIVIPITALRE